MYGQLEWRLGGEVALIEARVTAHNTLGKGRGHFNIVKSSMIYSISLD